MDMEYLENPYSYDPETDHFGQAVHIPTCRQLGAIKKSQGPKLWTYRKFTNVFKKNIKVEVNIHTPWNGMDEYIKQCKRSEMTNSFGNRE